MSMFDGLLNAARGQEQEQEPQKVDTSSQKKGGKRSHRDYRQTTIYVNKVIHRKLLRLLEDSGFEGDFSDWVEQKMKHDLNVVDDLTQQ